MLATSKNIKPLTKGDQLLQKAIDYKYPDKSFFGKLLKRQKTIKVYPDNPMYSVIDYYGQK